MMSTKISLVPLPVPYNETTVGVEFNPRTDHTLMSAYYWNSTVHVHEPCTSQNVSTFAERRFLHLECILVTKIKFSL